MIKIRFNGISAEFETVKELKEFLNEDSKIRPSLSQIDKQPQCILCFSTRVTIIKQTKNGEKTKYICNQCGKEFTLKNNIPNIKPRRKHRITWSKAKKRKFLKDLKKLTKEGLKEKYDLKSDQSIFRLTYEFMGELKREKNKERTGKEYENPNTKIREIALKELGGK